MAKTLSEKDSEFNIQQRIITDKTESNLSQWSIPQMWFTSTLIPSRTNWETAYATYAANPTERTTHMTFLKQEARKDYEPKLRQLIDLLAGDPVVTDADLESMGIVARRQGKHYPPISVPTDVPDFRIEQAIGNRLIMHFHAHEQDRESSVAKPHGVRGAEIAWGLLETPPTSQSELTNRAFDTATPYTFTFDMRDAGKTLYAALRWENSKGEKGPWSSIQSAIIP
jgi:hypothetical protein